jgi:hypothetical protein
MRFECHWRDAPTHGKHARCAILFELLGAAFRGRRSSVLQDAAGWFLGTRGRRREVHHPAQRKNAGMQGAGPGKGRKSREKRARTVSSEKWYGDPTYCWRRRIVGVGWPLGDLRGCTREDLEVRLPKVFYADSPLARAPITKSWCATRSPP